MSMRIGPRQGRADLAPRTDLLVRRGEYPPRSAQRSLIPERAVVLARIGFTWLWDSPDPAIRAGRSGFRPCRGTPRRGRRLYPRLGDELHACRRHAPEGVVEIIHAEQEAGPAGELIANGTGLGPAIRLRRQESCYGTGRAHDHPALRTPVVGERRRVLDEIETQHPDEELDGGVRVVDHQRRELDMHRRKPNRVLCAR